MVTKEQVDSHVSCSRRMLALAGDPNYTGGTKDEVIVALADENATLRAQLAEAVALLERWTSVPYARGHAPSAAMDTDEFLAKLRGAP